MQPKLKEDPREWRKFTLVMTILAGFIAFALQQKSRLTLVGRNFVWFFSALALLGAMIRPRSFRGCYRLGMSLSFYGGQAIGRVMLTLLFLVLVTPLGLFLRLLGKDLLRLKKDPHATTYWMPAKTSQEFDRLF